MIPYNKKLVSNAKQLRKDMTPEEKHLWYDLLKKLPCNVRRQHNIENYIVDFYIASKKTVIEVDGSQHASPDNKAYYQKRTEELSKWGIRVLRYKNREINTAFDVVCANILNNLGIKYEELKKISRTPHPPTAFAVGPPSPTGEGLGTSTLQSQ